MTGVSDKQVRELGIGVTPQHPESELRKAGALYESETGLGTTIWSPLAGGLPRPCVLQAGQDLVRSLGEGRPQALLEITVELGLEHVLDLGLGAHGLSYPLVEALDGLR